MKNKLIIITILIMVMVILSCTASSKNSKYGISYYYDEAHQVGIWTYSYASNSIEHYAGIAVLPASQIKNPQMDMKLTGIER